MDVLELLLQDGALKLEKEPETVEFIKGWYNGKGAFKDPQGRPDLISTAYALRVLRFLFSLQEVDLDEVGDFLLDCRNPDGGFSSRPEEGVSDIESTYYAISALHGMKREFEYEVTRFFVLGLLEDDGAFIDGPGRRKTKVYNSYYGTFSLAALGHEFQDNEKEAVLGFITNQENKDGGYRRSDLSKLSSITSTTAALLVRHYFEPEEEKGELDIYVDSLIHVSGGYLAFAGGVNPDIRSTFHALVCLRILGVPVHESVSEFVDSCRGPKGGFVGLAGEPLPNLEDTYYGMASLCLL
jgi:hypothetical protein